MNSSISVFVAACVGASIPLLFGWFKFPATSGRAQACLTCAYILVAGYVVACVLRVTEVFQAFMLGMAQDVLLKGLRAAAIRFSEGLVECKGKTPMGGRHEE